MFHTICIMSSSSITYKCAPNKASPRHHLVTMQWNSVSLWPIVYIYIYICIVLLTIALYRSRQYQIATVTKYSPLNQILHNGHLSILNGQCTDPAVSTMDRLYGYRLYYDIRLFTLSRVTQSNDQSKLF